MKKCYYFLMVMLLALVSVNLTACGDDDDEPSGGGDIVGTWQQKYVDEDGSGEVLIQFTKNGRFHEFDIYTDRDGDVDVAVDHGSYTLSGNKMTVTYDDDDFFIIECTVTVKGDKLTVSQSGYSTTYNRVKDSLIEKYSVNNHI